MRLLHPGDDARGRGAARARTPTRPTTRCAGRSPGNLCRCTGYINIVKAIQAAGARTAAPPTGLRRGTSPRANRQRGGATTAERSAASATASAQARTTGLIQGPGNYVDDIVLPGHAAHGAAAQPGRRTPASSRSTRARRRRSPGVVAVVTGEDLGAHNLAWMPTLSGDTQAVLATDKVRFQGQEVAAVDRRPTRTSPHDALELIDVEYDDRCPSSSTRSRRSPTDAPADPRREGGPDRQPLLPLGGRRQGGHRRAPSPRPTRSSTLDTFYPRSHPAPLETCGCVADVNPATGRRRST